MGCCRTMWVFLPLLILMLARRKKVEVCHDDDPKIKSVTSSNNRSCLMLTCRASEIARLRIVLASQSPRRREILSTAGLKFDIIPSTFEENLEHSSFSGPDAYVVENARRKALEVFQRIAGGEDEPTLVIGADTVVALDGRILEKPKNDKDARLMLESLSNRTHEVFTGVALVHNFSGLKDADTKTFHERTEVTFAPLRPDIIDGYISTGEPQDKAGSYGIQGVGGSMVSGISGCYFNVVGFPIHRFCVQLEQELSLASNASLSRGGKDVSED